MSGQTYFYTSGTTEPNDADLNFGYTNESTISVNNFLSNAEGTVMGAVYSGSPQIDGTFENLITPESYDISLVFQSPSPIKEIYNKTFNNCPGLRFVTLPHSLTSIGPVAFALPDGVSVPANQGLLDLSFTDISNSELQSIGTQAFANQANLSSITLPASVKSIGQMAFNGCGGLTSLLFHNISNSELQLIDTQAFQYTALTSVILPASLETIGPGAFSQVATTLTSVTFYDIALSRLETIYFDAFAGANIGTITIPNHITSIGTNAFLGSDGMTVYINSKAAGALNPPVSYSDTTFFGATGVTISPDPNTFEYTPGTTDPSTYNNELTILVNNSPGKTIPASAFEGLINVASTALVFANNSTTQSIGDDAFKNCTGLRDTTIPDSITAIGTNAFTGSGLQKVYISRTTAAVLKVSFSDTTFFGATGVTIVEYPVVTTPPPVIIFPYPKNEKNKRLLGVNQKISSGLARPNFKFQTNQFSAGRSRTAQSKQKANGPVTVIFPIR